MKRLIVAAVALSALVGGVAMADSHGQDRDRDERRADARYDSRHDKGHDNRRHDNRNDWDRDHRHYDSRPHGRYKVVRYVPPRDYRARTWYRGARLPVAYYAPRYVVNDYAVYRLRPPPRGYHWVRVDNDVVLAAITTGVVLEVVDHIFFH
ncbi:MAG TPA: RcnB family protein [Povalibacter sp.]|nr:RcnB family protein [Povalibacter sp.]